MTLATLVAYLVLAAVIFSFDPTKAPFLVIFFFYASLFLSIVGTFSVLGFLLRHFLDDDVAIFRQVIISFRQALWLGIVALTSFILQRYGLFNLLSLFALCLALATLEFFFMIRSVRQPLNKI